MKVSGQKLVMQEFGSLINKKLLGVHIDRTLSFDEHVSNLCKKAGRKLSVLARFSSYTTLTQRTVLMKSFIEAQFGCCPIVWMFHGRVLNRKINHLHERSLRIVYKDSIRSFHELLQKDHSFTIHLRNIQSLPIRLYKIFLLWRRFKHLKHKQKHKQKHLK